LVDGVLPKQVGPGARPTLEQVARVAGVSRGTASRALNGGRNVSPRAMDAVTKAAAELGYRPNLAARSLVLGRSESVGLVISETDERLFVDPFFAAIVRSVHAELAATGTQLVLALAQHSEDREKMVRFASGRHLDGVLLISLHDDDPLPAALEEVGIPVVLAGRGDGTGTCWVDADNRGGARLATGYLLSLGRRHPVTVAGPEDMTVSRDRLLGWEDALREARLAPPRGAVEHGDFTEVSGYMGMRRLLQRVPGLDAVFAASDPMALGALRALRDAGRRVPQDVAVIGFDDAPAAQLADPPLTTIRQPVDEMGRLLVHMLVARMAGEPLTQTRVIVPTELVRRATA
jgi:DNA-binding LacI/PurR family transcriptional regulator